MLGGAPGSRMVTSLEPEMVRGNVDRRRAVGRLGYGLDAAGGASAVLCARVVARLSGASPFRGGSGDPVDLVNGGDKPIGCASR